MDVDGVLTDGKIILGNGNIELKAFNVRDGLAISLASKNGLKTAFITSRISEAVTRRGKELKVDYLRQGATNKLDELNKIVAHAKITLDEVCYIGDDLIDIELLKVVGFSATVVDAPKEVKSCVSFVSNKQGGEGAVREIIELILKTRGNWQ